MKNGFEKLRLVFWLTKFYNEPMKLTRRFDGLYRFSINRVLVETNPLIFTAIKNKKQNKIKATNHTNKHECRFVFIGEIRGEKFTISFSLAG